MGHGSGDEDECVGLPQPGALSQSQHSECSQGTTAVEDIAAIIPNSFVLQQNYPNPFNPSTIISYSIFKPGFVTLTIYNILGRETKTLVSEFQIANTYSVNFDASKLSSGIYFYRLQVGHEFVGTKKMLLMR
ncbi:T9SS type A sorting domain-containing protein [candidate division KSB1 bacterium]|nr:T9SS type A sorting domain-containing protein [candidate division KSB1 bacterium]